jgi:hypothetical protein
MMASLVGGAAALEPVCGPTELECRQATEVARNAPRTPSTTHPTTTYINLVTFAGGSIGPSVTPGVF